MPEPTQPSAAPAPVEAELRGGTPVGRRVILGGAGLAALGVVAGPSVVNTIATFGDPPAASVADPGASVGEFRIYTVTHGYPDMPIADYRLRVTGLAESPRTLSFTDLAALPQTSMTKDFQCVTGWRVTNVPWSGVLLRDLVDAVQPKANATALRFTSFDGVYTESLTLEQAQRDDILIATSMFGEPLKPEHGAPVRLMVAPMYGYKSLKWLDGIEVTAEVIPGYWESISMWTAYAVDAWVGKSNGRTDDPVT